MVTQEQIHLNYIKKEPQTGSDTGMRYRLSKGKNDDGDCIDAAVWPEPFCFVKTPEDKKTCLLYTSSCRRFHQHRTTAVHFPEHGVQVGHTSVRLHMMVRLYRIFSCNDLAAVSYTHLDVYKRQMYPYRYRTIPT